VTRARAISSEDGWNESHSINFLISTIGTSPLVH
jgi:hypothetical protein